MEIDNKKIDFNPENIAIERLKPHPRNYRIHPDDQLEHIMQSIRDHGIYRAIVISNDDTILAGHGVVQAAKKLGMLMVPIKRLNIDSNSDLALKLLAGDNEISHLSVNDDRLLTELLKEVKTNNQLLGTGYDDLMLANLLVVTRPLSEIKNINEAAHWVGMPEYEEAGDGKLRLLISFPDENAREEFVQKCELRIDMKRERIWTTRYPWTERNDKASLAYVNENENTPPLSDLHPQ